MVLYWLLGYLKPFIYSVWKNKMRNFFFLLVILLLATLTTSCNSDSNNNGTTKDRDRGFGTQATITAANVGVVSGETAIIMDVVGAVATMEEALLDTGDITIPCSLAGYGGNGTITLYGSLRSPGDWMDISFNGCTLAGAPLTGTTRVTLNSKFQNDEGEGYSTTFTYQEFAVGSGTNMFTLNGTISLQASYDYLKETMTTTRTTSLLQLEEGQTSAKITDLKCVDSYTGMWDSGPFTMDCMLTFDSVALGGSINAVTTELFRGVGGENRPSSGELLITGANNSKTLFIAQQDGEHVLVKWDEDGDDTYEGQLLRTWQAIKQDMLNWSNLLK